MQVPAEDFSPATRPKTVPEILAEMASEGDPAPTGFPPLDRQFRRGGLPPSSILVIGGPPHTGKTTLAEQIGLHISQTRPVIGLFADEGSKPAARRIALMLGVTDGILDSEPDRAVELATAALEGRSLTLWPTEADQATADDVVAYVTDTFATNEENPIVILDSIQTIPLNRELDAQSPRLAAKALVSQCRHWASAHGITFILTSQSNRQSYRSQRREENSEAITSFSETSAIEYMADIALVLSLPEKDSELVNCRLVKNRLKGTAKSFSIQFSTTTYSMLEADQAEIEAIETTARVIAQKPIKDKITTALKTKPPLSKNAICEAAHVGRKAGYEAIDSLINEKKLIASPTQSGSGFRYTLSLDLA